MIGIPLGLLASNAGEWLIHKYLLHGRGKHKESFWAFHWHAHHRASRRHGHYDSDYEDLRPTINPRTKEIGALVGSALLYTPLLPVAPFFTLTVWYSHLKYYQVHKRSHLDPEWAREHLPWHYDHHMGPNQDANWCVTRPWFDQIMGTREVYVGTDKELKNRDRDQERWEARLNRTRRTPKKKAPGPKATPIRAA